MTTFHYIALILGVLCYIAGRVSKHAMADAKLARANRSFNEATEIADQAAVAIDTLTDENRMLREALRRALEAPSRGIPF